MMPFRQRVVEGEKQQIYVMPVSVCSLERVILHNSAKYSYADMVYAIKKTIFLPLLISVHQIKFKLH